MDRPILAIDADGVLVDLHAGYARAWRQAFGVTLAERDPQAYWPMDRWEVEPLAVTSVRSSFFDDRSVFPAGSIEFDCALLMRGIDHEWRGHPDLCCAAEETRAARRSGAVA